VTPDAAVPAAARTLQRAGTCGMIGAIAAVFLPMHVARLTSLHRRRLREVWRSAGWPAQDIVEAELLAMGLLERLHDAAGRCTLRVTDAGIQTLAESAALNRAARSDHETLVEQVAQAMIREGRIAWRGLSLRARVVTDEVEGWQMAMPDVYSVRHTSVAAYLQPVVHEIKVRRADLLADLRRPAKRAAYLDMAGAVVYVLAEGIGRADEVPPECGVMEMRGGQLEVLRPAPVRALPHDAGLPFAIWMALARATPVRAPESEQRRLGEAPEGDPLVPPPDEDVPA
jgi:hypothetical protein